MSIQRPGKCGKQEGGQATKQVPILEVSTTNKESESADDSRLTRRKRAVLKSGKLRTANTKVLHSVTWPHEMVYTTGQLTVYYDLSLTLFVSSYLMITAVERGQ